MFLGPVVLYRAADATNKRRSGVGFFGADLRPYPGAGTRLVETGTNKNDPEAPAMHSTVMTSLLLSALKVSISLLFFALNNICVQTNINECCCSKNTVEQQCLLLFLWPFWD